LPEEISYRFNGSGADRTVALGAFVAITLIPQAFFTLMALAVTRIVMLGARYAPPGETPLKQLLPIMGNMLALPQIILFFAMLQIFLYNAYQTGIIPLWIIAITVLVAGGIVLVALFIRIIRRFRRRKS
jgi:hypothetical protein